MMLSNLLLGSLEFLDKIDIDGFKNSKVDYEMASFGYYPFGREIYGVVLNERSLGCKNFELNNI